MKPPQGSSTLAIDALHQPIARLFITYYWVPWIVSLSVSLVLFVMKRPVLVTWHLAKNLTYESTLFYLSFYPVLLMVAILFRRFLIDKLSDTFVDLLHAGSLTTHNKKLLADFQSRLNSVFAEIFGIIGGIAIFWVFHDQLREWFSTFWKMGWRTGLLFMGLYIVLLVIQILWGYFSGVAIWKLLAIAFELQYLCEKGHLKVHALDPDRCGGLSGIGRLYLDLSLILALLGTFLGAWSFYAHTHRGLKDVFPNWETPLAVAVLVLVIVSFVISLLPLLPVHRLMKVQVRQLDPELARLRDRITALEESLLSESAELEVKELQARRADIQSLSDYYHQAKRLPTWPVDTTTLMTILTVQAPLVVAFFLSCLKLWDQLRPLPPSHP